jgi:hypothetical protein
MHKLNQVNLATILIKNLASKKQVKLATILIKNSVGAKLEKQSIVRIVTLSHLFK